MPYSVCKIQKISSWAVLATSEAHTARTRHTPNANPEAINVRVIGSPDDPSLAVLVKDKIGSQKIRSNAVLAVDMLLSASAEYFRPHAPKEGGTYDKQRLDDFVLATKMWLLSTWVKQIIRAELHLDEITPHIHAYLVPLDNRGKLNCRELFGTRYKLQKLQDSFASAVEHLGISRGVKGSSATYMSIKKYYAAVQGDSPIIDLSHSFPQIEKNETVDSYRERVIDTLSPQLEIINYQLGERERIVKQNAQLKETAFRSEKLRQQLETEVLRLQVKTTQLLDLPQDLITHEMGLNNNKQLNSIAKNSLLLVMRINRCAFNDAAVWLRERFGETAMLNAVAHHAVEQALTLIRKTQATIFIPPTPSLNRWSEVANYLTDICYIPQKLVQSLQRQGLVYASTQGDAVFLARNLLPKVTGAYFHKLDDAADCFNLYPDSNLTSGWFYLSMGGKLCHNIQAAVLVSSPIEALSLAVLNVPHSSRTLYLNVDSDCTKLPTEFLQNVPNVVIATPKEIGSVVKHALPEATLVSPKSSWNYQLRKIQAGQNHTTLE
jgi:Plasmid recombination enzyme